jgi:dTDP-4-amino-4,6-dideoxygalactose transaminase
LVANATLGLITALQALGVRGEVITTPYSFVATAHSILWHGNRPVFVDVEPNTLNIDPQKVEAAITSQTTAILAVHCYGNPCDVDAIQSVADKHNLRVIYDAAHAFGVKCHCGSLLNHGDLSVLSFHATKVFNTFEGGAIVCPDLKTKQHIDNLKNFGFVDETTVVACGINAKMSEISAAFGLLQLQHQPYVMSRRAEIDRVYRDLLSGIEGIECLPKPGYMGANYSYFPVLIKQSFPLTRDELYEMLKTKNVFARRYFYPLISEFPVYRSIPSASPGNLPIATKAAAQILCLPIYPALTAEDQFYVVETLKDAKRMT